MRALLSVHDKTGIEDLGRELALLGYEIVATGGTLAALQGAGLPAMSVSAVTAFPEILDGRVKTLHPTIHGGLLARRDDPSHLAALAAHGIAPIDLVAVNLYPFATTVRDPRVSFEEAVEQIDIGGPAMIRAAAKNCLGVIVLTDPSDYGPIVDQIRQGTVTPIRRRGLAAKAFAHVASYDAVVADYLRGVSDQGGEFPVELSVAGRKVLDLRYGENPQQRGAAYRRLVAGAAGGGVLEARQLAGQELSFNNLLDADAAWGAVRGFAAPTVAIVKHTIPCGLASRPRLVDAYQLALAGDPVSAFGGIVALNRPVDGETARIVAETFFEVMIAPGFDDEAREAFSHKKRLRLLELPASLDRAGAAAHAWDVRPIRGGLLVQELDDGDEDSSAWRVVTKRPPSDREWDDLRFAWAATRQVKSNAIVLVKDQAVIGVGSGQPNRLESVRIAVRTGGHRVAGAVVASDAFFPFADGLEAAAQAGASAAVQPGGSVRDSDVVAAADAAGMAMVFTGVRHFRH